MKVTKVLVVLGLLLAISAPASALTWKFPYVGPVNIDFDFVSADGFNAAGEEISWGIFRARTITATTGGETLWNDKDGGIELSGILYKLKDEAQRIRDNPFPGYYQVDIWGNDLYMDIFQNTPGDYMAARALGTGGWGALGNDSNPVGNTATEHEFEGLTKDGAVHRAIALRGMGTSIIAVHPAATDMAGGTPAPITAGEQKTEVIIEPVGGGTPKMVTGSSVAYIDWYDGYLFEPTPGFIIPDEKFDASAHPPIGFSFELIPDAESMARATQAFLTTDTGYMPGIIDPSESERDDLAADGWLFVSHGTGGSLTTYVVPEPLTMIAVFGSIAGLGGYIRKRRSRSA